VERRGSEIRAGLRGCAEDFRDHIRGEAKRRAIDGWEEPLFWKGQPTGHTIRKKSDRMLELLLKAHCPEFRDTIEHKGRLTLEKFLPAAEL
jgi:hypothetical protein